MTEPVSLNFPITKTANYLPTIIYLKYFTLKYINKQGLKLLINIKQS